jgi:23S rRNA (cytosine1962-C5)-methyltransferase
MHLGEPMDTPNPYPRVVLRRGGDRRVLRGHPWVFSNEIAEAPVGEEPGSPVRVLDGRERPVGVGYYNPHSLIAVRLMRRDDGPLDRALLAAALDEAIALRERIYPESEAVRIVHAESDRLPGLVVDRYRDHLVVQVTTAGMERLLPEVLGLLIERFTPRCIVARNDTPFRRLEGLAEEIRVLHGELDPGLRLDWEGLHLELDLTGGQKTGLFLDQRDNQRAFLPVAACGSVLDAFCYQGMWGLLALRAGARELVGVDSSTGALERARHHAEANGLGERVEWRQGDVLEALKDFRAQGRRFDLVVLDPPAFVKNRRSVSAGLKGYLDVNRRGIELVAPGGFLITCSCSHHVRPEVFRDTVAHAASLAGRHVRVIGQGTQSRDHPPLLTAPETEYLKCLLLHVV